VGSGAGVGSGSTLWGLLLHDANAIKANMQSKITNSFLIKLQFSNHTVPSGCPDGTVKIISISYSGMGL
jgi:hypothetical protein